MKVGGFVKYPEEVREDGIEAQVRRWEDNRMMEHMHETDYDNECTCEVIEWEPTEDGFKGCPFCETYDGEWDDS